MNDSRPGEKANRFAGEKGDIEMLGDVSHIQAWNDPSRTSKKSSPPSSDEDKEPA